MKISVHFISIYPLKKPNFSSVWHGPLSRWLPFEHSDTKMGSLDIELVYSTLCTNITSTRSASKFHHMLQCSVGGDVMLDAITYGQDWSGHSCTMSMHPGPRSPTDSFFYNKKKESSKTFILSLFLLAILFLGKLNIVIAERDHSRHASTCPANSTAPCIGRCSKVRHAAR